MKTSVSAICLGALIIFILGCKKDDKLQSDIIQSDINSDMLIGMWELTQARNGMTPTIDFSTGHGNILHFSENSYERYENGKLVKKGKYQLIRDSSVESEVGLVITNGQFINRIMFDHNFTSRKIFVEVAGHKLTLLSGYFPTDGGSYTVYEKR